MLGIHVLEVAFNGIFQHREHQLVLAFERMTPLHDVVVLGWHESVRFEPAGQRFFETIDDFHVVSPSA
jgi:hypothetical protein